MRRGIESWLTRRGAAAAAAIAFATGLPALSLPLLSDDWSHLAAVADGVIVRTPFGYFRPLCSVTYWLEWRVFGLQSAAYHVSNLTLAAAAAALVVSLARRYTGDALLAGVAGCLFALHPYHIENVAWIAGRSDVLSAILLLTAVLAYDRWRAKAHGLPFGALGLYALALLSKESAVVLPLFLGVVAIFDRRRRASFAELIRGYVPLVVLTLLHFVVLRPFFLGDASMNALRWTGGWSRRLYLFAVASLTPAQTELLEAHPLLWGCIAALAATILCVAALSGTGRLPGPAWPAAAAFIVLLGPSLISFQQRFLFLPSAAAAVAIAALLRAAGRRAGIALAAVLVVGWQLSAVNQWASWKTAARASERLIGSLARIAADPRVEELVVVAMPHRIAGAPVRADFTAALPLLGARSVEVVSATEIDYSNDTADALTRDLQSTGSEVRLEIPRARYSRYVWPPLAPGVERVEQDWGRILVETRDALTVQVDPAPGRVSFVWAAGDLEPL